MTESQWLACTEPQTMLKFLAGKTSERKLRLFAATCCRTIWHLLLDERSKKAVEVLERFADREATPTELCAAAQDARRAAEDGERAENPYAGWTAANAVGTGQVPEEDEDSELDDVTLALRNAKDTAFSSAWAIGHYFHPTDSSDAWFTTTKAHEAAQGGLLRCIFGNPFHPSTLNPRGLTAIVTTLAQAAYDNRILPAGTLDTNRLAVLADALEEAGCSSADILSHCRQPGEHCRGCFVIDLLLRKE